MTKSVLLIALSVLFAGSAFAQQPNSPNPEMVVHVATALNHLTVLEFHEPVTMAAAGSSDFQIEREANKVFVKPTKSGASTDLFVWTASRRFAYELETTEEVKNMNFAIDSAQPVPAAKPVMSAPTDEIADMVLTRALLGAEKINQPRLRAAKKQVAIQIEQVFRTKSNLYIHYRIENKTHQLYRVGSPRAHQLETDGASISLSGLVHNQLDGSAAERLGATHELPLSVAHAESESQQLEPGETTQGVIAIRQDLKSPTVVQLEFEDGVKATVVL
ncbi:MAG: TrbG/VirB9 family P-type conjugative transfer protein [Acidobacteriaceae bacterium]